MPLPHTEPGDPTSRSSPDVCVGVVLGDALHRMTVLGGREGMPRSLGSVYAAVVTRFLGGGLRGVVSRVINTRSSSNGIAVSVDGCTLLVSDSSYGGSHAIHELSMADGSRRRVVGGKGDGPLQFNCPRQVFIAPDGFVFIADGGNNRVQVLTPTLDFHSFIGQGELVVPAGVCANADVVVLSNYDAHRIAVFNRDGDGSMVRQFGCRGSDDGQMQHPAGLCFMSDDRHVAVADPDNHRVNVFSVDGEFIRHVGVGVLRCPRDVACTAFDELVVTDTDCGCLRLFSTAGDLLASAWRCTAAGSSPWTLLLAS